MTHPRITECNSSTPCLWARVCLGQLVIVGMLLAAHCALAAEAVSALKLDWAAPAECPTEQSVAGEALRLASIDGSALPRVHAKVIVERSADSTYVLTLTTSASERGSMQTLRARTCGAVAQAAAVTLALLLNPGSAGTGSQPATPDAHALSEAAPAPAVPVRFAALALAGVQLGLLPQVGPVVGAEVGLAYGSASLWVGALYGPRQREILDAPANIGGELTLGAAFLYACWRVAGGQPELNLCGGVDSSRVWGRGVGVVNERSDDISWFSAIGGAAAQVSLSPKLLLRVGAFGTAPFSRPNAFIEGAGAVYRPEPVNARVHAAFGALIP